MKLPANTFLSPIADNAVVRIGRPSASRGGRQAPIVAEGVSCFIGPGAMNIARRQAVGNATIFDATNYYVRFHPGVDIDKNDIILDYSPVGTPPSDRPGYLRVDLVFGFDQGDIHPEAWATWVV